MAAKTTATKTTRKKARYGECRECGVRVKAKGLSGPLPAWCAKHKDPRNRVKAAPARRVKPVKMTTVCQGPDCGKEFTYMYTGGQKTLYCSNACSQRAQRARVPDKRCIICGVNFRPPSNPRHDSDLCIDCRVEVE